MTPLEMKCELVDKIKKYFDTTATNDSIAVIGISGGKDSSIAAALCAEALGPDRVYGVLMPNGEQKDIKDAYRLVWHLGIKYSVVNINQIYDAFMSVLPEATHKSAQATQNLPPRIRMSVLYAFAQNHNGRVVNTCNLSEDVVGYYTIWGDGAGDFAPFANLTATEVIAIGCETNLPIELVVKAPSDGLCGKTDEDNLGFTYADLDNYLRNKRELVSNETINKIETKIRANSFKSTLPLPFTIGGYYE